jgi:hypothetical protein
MFEVVVAAVEVSLLFKKPALVIQVIEIACTF